MKSELTVSSTRNASVCMSSMVTGVSAVCALGRRLSGVEPVGHVPLHPPLIVVHVAFFVLYNPPRYRCDIISQNLSCTLSFLNFDFLFLKSLLK